MIPTDKEHYYHRDAEKLKESGDKAGMSARVDPSGTDPDRYKSVSSSSSGNQSRDEDYNKEPKNHTTTDERLINPDRGE